MSHKQMLNSSATIDNLCFCIRYIHAHAKQISTINFTASKQIYIVKCDCMLFFKIQDDASL